MLHHKHTAALFALANQYDRAGRATEAANLYKQAANLGHAAAQYNLGASYENGDGIAKDPAEALRWYNAAATQGHAAAQWRLSVIHGRGFLSQPINAERSFYWKQQAANSGQRDAQFSLGYAYQHGDRVAEDIKAAITWYTKAAAQALPAAFYNLGVLHNFGAKGVPRNSKLAEGWLRKAKAVKYTPAFAPLAQIYMEGLDEVKQDEKTAVSLLQQGAAQGDASAQCNLGVAYERGQGGIAADEKIAIGWYEKSAAQGYATAQSNLAEKFFTGRGLSQDYSRALYWYKLAAAQGDARAESALGHMFFDGKGVPQNTALAVDWLRKAATQGDNAAQYLLGYIHAQDEGGFKDKAKAGELLREAAAAPEHKDNITAWHHLATFYADEGLYVLAIPWYQKAAEMEHAQAQYDLALMYKDGLGVQQDNEAALYWFSRAASQRKTEAQFSLAMMARQGVGMAQNNTFAAYWLGRAAVQGDAASQNLLGAMYEAGEGVPQDDAKALHWFSKAAEQGDAMARNNLGIMYYGAKDFKSAIREFTIAAEAGNMRAQEFLGTLYLYGDDGIPANPIKALELLTRARAQGSREANILLAQCYIRGEGGVEKNSTLGWTCFTELFSVPVVLTAAAHSAILSSSAAASPEVVSSPTAMSSSASLSSPAAASPSMVSSHTAVSTPKAALKPSVKIHTEEKSGIDETTDQLLIDLSHLRNRVLCIASNYNKAVIKKYLAQISKIINDVNVLDFRLHSRTLHTRIQQLSKTYREFNDEITAKEAQATLAKPSAPRAVRKPAEEKKARSLALPVSAAKKAHRHITTDRSEVMLQKLHAVLKMLSATKDYCAGPKVHSDRIIFYAVIADIGETYNALVNFQDDYKYAHLYEDERTWLARCNAFGDPDLIHEDLAKIMTMPASLHAHILTLERGEEEDEAKTSSALCTLFQEPVEVDSKDMHRLVTSLRASLDHSMAAIAELKSSSAHLNDPMHAKAFAGACMRFDKVAVKLMGVNYGLYRTHYRTLHKQIAPLGRELRHFNFRQYHPDDFLKCVRQEYADMQFQSNKKAPIATKSPPSAAGAGSASSSPSAGMGSLLASVGMSAHGGAAAAAAAAPTAAKKAPLPVTVARISGSL
ncbi:hypothetical protein BH10PSE19_BH10PSE19_10650 [soil metagenome]